MFDQTLGGQRTREPIKASSLSPLGALHEHPAMAFQILCPIESTVRRIFRRRKNSRAGPLRALIVGVNTTTYTSTPSTAHGTVSHSRMRSYLLQRVARLP